ncbi:MAG: phospholipase D-like domain-containing protein [Steroidobacteraceae bacterium]|jgi:phosphatidylserine/phosphatidylglycerophosphate/cardiolipin synthase-like enzyme
MRKKVLGDVDVVAMSGTHVVFLGFDMPKSAAKRLMGYAIYRKDKTELEGYWLRSIKTFESIDQLAGNEDASSHEAPFQSFQWADYTAKPGHEYVYTVYPMTGTPGNLKEGNPTAVSISTEDEDPVDDSPYGIHFNRGVISSQAYVKRFGLVSPEKAGPAAFEWLTRDLLPAMLAFISKANAGWSLHCAFYEFQYPAVIQALKDAKKRGADVHVLYGATPDTETTTANEEALATEGTTNYFKPRTNAKIPHNKFMVLSKGKTPKSVWTGSTNVSTSALFGQLNVGIVADNSDVAKLYRAFWEALSADPETADLRTTLEDLVPLDVANSEPVQVIFSPMKGTAVYDYYTQLAAGAQAGLFMTFPFGMSTEFRDVYDHKDGVLRYSLLDKYVNGGTPESRKAAIADTIRIRKFPNIMMALGSSITVDSVDGWRKEKGPLGVHVHWVHTKFMLVDPFSKRPTVVSGSANWSLPSTNANDENMLIIRGDRRVADIYFGEFMRIFAHHRFREALAIHLKEHGSVDDWKPNFLKDNPDEWVPKHYENGGRYQIQRVYFSTLS